MEKAQSAQNTGGEADQVREARVRDVPFHSRLLKDFENFRRIFEGSSKKPKPFDAMKTFRLSLR